MVSLDEYKRALGAEAEGIPDSELERMNKLSERLAGILFDAWMKKIKS